MLKKVKVRVTRVDKNDKDKQVTAFEPAIIQTDNIVGILHSGAPGSLAIGFVDGTNFVIKDTIEGFLKK